MASSMSKPVYEITATTAFVPWRRRRHEIRACIVHAHRAMDRNEPDMKQREKKRGNTGQGEREGEGEGNREPGSDHEKRKKGTRTRMNVMKVTTRAETESEK